MLPVAPPAHAVLAQRELESDWLRAVAALADRPGFWWLDASLPDPRQGRHSYAGCAPWLRLEARGRALALDVERAAWPGLAPGRYPLEGDALDALRALLSPRPGRVPADAPPFAGGFVGWLGHELAAGWLPLGLAPDDELGLPDAGWLGCDGLIACDHLEGKVRAIALGYGADAREAERRADERLAELIDAASGEPVAARLEPAPELAAAPAPDVLTPRVTRREHERRVRTILAHIRAGDVYQACLTHRLDGAFSGDPLRLHATLRAANPAPFGAYLAFPELALIASSPERFLALTPDGRAESRPIKGTRPRGATPARDRALQRELAASAKDHAENLMIVDLVRNDLGRVCELGSIHVPELAVIEPYARVFQMVSTVRGRLRPECDVFDLLRAAFPPGSMTGAPKLAALEILERLEPVRRGPYAGACGWLDLRGGAGLAVVIRTLLVAAGRVHAHSGGGIVADSDPAGEWEEAAHKVRPLIEAVARAAAHPARSLAS